jgi:hypothetical protein
MPWRVAFLLIRKAFQPDQGTDLLILGGSTGRRFAAAVFCSVNS